MKKVFYSVLFLIFIGIVFNSEAYAENVYVSMYINGHKPDFQVTPFIEDGVTMADAQILAKELGLKYSWYPSLSSATISDSRTSIGITAENEFMTVTDLTGISNSEYNNYILSTTPKLSMGRLQIPVRDLVKIFYIPLSFDAETLTVHVGKGAYTYTGAFGNHTYYFQNQEEFALESFGSGYCWVCSYAMLLTDVIGYRITPLEIANVNLQKGTQGAYCYHHDIMQKFGTHFVSALDEKSPYYNGRDDNSGGTFIKNPDRLTYIAAKALKEALDLHPEGVLVRFAAFPHTMVAVGYLGDMILFNDPASSASGYSAEGQYNEVPFEETCVAKKGFSIADITFLQAIAK